MFLFMSALVSVSVRLFLSLDILKKIIFLEEKLLLRPSQKNKKRINRILKPKKKELNFGLFFKMSMFVINTISLKNVS